MKSEKNKRTVIKELGIGISSYIRYDFPANENKLKIEITAEEKNGITYAVENMQEDAADFEALAFCLWSKYPDHTFELRFEKYPFRFSSGNILDITDTDPKTNCYLRFLYRAYKMKKYFGDRFVIDGSNIDEVLLFEKCFEKAMRDNELRLTQPEKSSGISDPNRSNKRKTENHLEKWFVLNSTNPKTKNIVPETCRIKMYDQLPCGLFYKETAESGRLFSGGAFDLWGINDNGELCLFELKQKSNRKLGIISELFFYANFMKDMKEIAGRQQFNNNSIRGFDKFLKASGHKINAYFLVPEYTMFIRKNIGTILKIMNSPDNGITYGSIIFDQDSIIGSDYMDFYNKLKEDWDNRNE